jgi:hypothetical protein
MIQNSNKFEAREASSLSYYLEINFCITVIYFISRGAYRRETERPPIFKKQIKHL